jgi:hypothetical protein
MGGVTFPGMDLLLQGHAPPEAGLRFHVHKSVALD